MAASEERAGRGFLALLGHKHFLPACFVSFMTVRGLMFLIPYTLDADPLWYVSEAAGLSRGLGYVLDQGPTAYYPIGWSAFLAIFFRLLGPTLFVAQGVDLALAAATFFLVLAIARTTFQSESVARLSVLLLAVYPNSIANVAIPVTETFFTFLLLLAWLLWIRYASAAVAATCGVVLGLAALTRTQAVLLPALFAASDIFAGTFRRSAYRRLFMLCVVMAVTLLPWLYRNYLAFGEFPILSTNGGMNMLIGNNSLARGGYTHDATIELLIDVADGNEARADHLATSLAIDWIAQHPRKFIFLMPAKFARLWGTDSDAVWIYQQGYARFEEYKAYFQTARFLDQGYYAALLAGFAVAPIVWRRRYGLYFLPGTQFAYLLAGWTTILALVTFGDSRFHFAIMPFAIMHASAVVISFWRNRKPQPT